MRSWFSINKICCISYWKYTVIVDLYKEYASQLEQIWQKYIFRSYSSAGVSMLVHRAAVNVCSFMELLSLFVHIATVTVFSHGCCQCLFTELLTMFVCLFTELLEMFVH